MLTRKRSRDRSSGENPIPDDLAQLPTPVIIDLVHEDESEDESSEDTTDSETEEERGPAQPNRVGSVVRYPYHLTADQRDILVRRGMEQSYLGNVSFSSSAERYAWVGDQLRALPSNPAKRLCLTPKQKSALINFGYHSSYLDSMQFGSSTQRYAWVGMQMDSAIANNVMLKIFGDLL